MMNHRGMMEEGVKGELKKSLIFVGQKPCRRKSHFRLVVDKARKQPRGNKRDKTATKDIKIMMQELKKHKIYRKRKN